VPTNLLEVDPVEPSESVIGAAAEAIRRGQVVAIPTDGLYSLVADPFNLQAVGRVFAAKGREPVRSLPLLVSELSMAEELCAEVSARFRLLARVLSARATHRDCPGFAEGSAPGDGQHRASRLRHSRSQVAQALLQRLQQPLIATSANISGQPTCTSGISVFGTMDGRLDLVLDGGTCPGLGPTTIDITEPYWRVIKEGAVPERTRRGLAANVRHI
jgi:L-threonylcarbamoyladenylate synthase